jgi:hypothetical protein
MKRLILLWLIVAATISVTAVTPVVELVAFADSAAATNSLPTADEPVPVTDRVPWLIYVVLTSSSVALAWILFSLARARMKDTGRHEEK